MRDWVFWIFWLFPSKNPLSLVFRHFNLTFNISRTINAQIRYFSNVWVIGTGIWPLSGHGIGLFRATLSSNIFSFVEAVVKLFKNYDLHVVGEVEICFQTNTLKGVNFIVNRCPLMCEVWIYVEGSNTLIFLLFWYYLDKYSLMIKAWWKRVVYECRSQRNTCKSNKEISQIYNIFLRWLYPCSTVNKHGHQQYKVDPCQK